MNLTIDDNTSITTMARKTAKKLTELVPIICIASVLRLNQITLQPRISARGPQAVTGEKLRLVVDASVGIKLFHKT